MASNTVITPMAIITFVYLARRSPSVDAKKNEANPSIAPLTPATMVSWCDTVWPSTGPAIMFMNPSTTQMVHTAKPTAPISE